MFPHATIVSPMLLSGEIIAHDLSAAPAPKAAGQRRGYTYNVRGILDIRRVDRLVTTHVDIVKMDIEGYEPEALLGMAGIFRPPLPRLVLSEFQPSVIAANGFDAREYLRFFASRGYRISVSAPGSGKLETLLPVGNNEHQALAWLNRTSWSKAYDLVMRAHARRTGARDATDTPRRRRGRRQYGGVVKRTGA